MDNHELAGTSNRDDELTEAKAILQSRPRVREIKLPSKGGAKLNNNLGTLEEERRLDAYYDTLHKSLTSLKVGKVCNLGVAEWLPDLHVAKVIKQAKFMQTKSHYHHEEFFALFAEEALFLLDVGEIELTFKQVPLSMQEAYCMLLSDCQHDMLCTLEEYQVYAHLTRIGYRVQRYKSCNGEPSQDTQKERAEDPSTPNKLTNKRPLDKSDDPVAFKLKKDSIETIPDDNTFEIMDNEEHSDSKEQLLNNTTGENLTRGWWLSFESKSDQVTTKDTSPSLCNDFKCLNFASIFEESVSPELDPQTVPPNCNPSAKTVPKIWSERISRSVDHNAINPSLPTDFSYPKHADDVTRSVKSWSEYKAKKRKAHLLMQQETRQLCRSMHGGEIKPLLHPLDLTSTAHVLDILSKGGPTTYKGENLTAANRPGIRYNVFQTDKTKPFRKTQPGRPFLRIAVFSSDDTMPGLADFLYFKDLSPNVPVKIAFVDNGRVVFFGIDQLDVPIDIFMG